ncbi:MAG TPA: hypothetical protein VF865_19640 [Acidobacteriaceae bacterium]
MTADPAVHSATFLPINPSCGRPDAVRARITAGHQCTYAEGMRSDAANSVSTEGAPSGAYLPPDTRGPRKPHPGDVLYWVACLGGACLLLLSATT